MARRRKPDPDQELDPDEIEELEAEGALDSRGLLRDGARLRVPLYLKDGAINPNLTATQRGKALQQTEDAVARSFGLADGLALHKPGFRRVTDAAALQRVQAAYTAYDAADVCRLQTHPRLRRAYRQRPLSHRRWRPRQRQQRVARQLSVLCWRRRQRLHHQRRSGHLGAPGQRADLSAAP